MTPHYLISIPKCNFKLLPIRAPRMNGETFFTRIEFVGLLPSKTLCGNKRRNSSVSKVYSLITRKKENDGLKLR